MGPEKARINHGDHRVYFQEAFSEMLSLSQTTSPIHSKNVTSRWGMGAKGRVLVVVYTYRGENIRIISARKAEPHELEDYGQQWKLTIFRKANVVGLWNPNQNQQVKPESRSDSMRIFVDYFMGKADKSGGKVGYQTLINEALRQHVQGNSPSLEAMLRRVLREELHPS